MKIIIDTNILISALLAGNQKFRDILLSGRHDFYACHYTFIEILKLKEKILKYSKLREEELLELLYKILGSVHFTSESLLSAETKAEAIRLCHDIDPADTPFVALTIELQGVLWTGDKVLKDWLKNKNFNRFFEV